MDAVLMDAVFELAQEFRAIAVRLEGSVQSLEWAGEELIADNAAHLAVQMLRVARKLESAKQPRQNPTGR